MKIRLLNITAGSLDVFCVCVCVMSGERWHLANKIEKEFEFDDVKRENVQASDVLVFKTGC